MKNIQNNLRALRKAKGLTQWDVAKHLGFSSTDRISKWESGKQYPHLTNAIKVAKLLDTQVEDFYKDLRLPTSPTV